MSAFEVSGYTREQQARASDPATSVFVAANAGSGKTHVLTERVVRLLLARAPPSKILCLTYTKAAAAEMSNRVFRRLAEWATAPRADLAAELARLLGREPSAEEIADARKLFAEALETPGGLKIQTIHAFCEAILHQFPLEANVPGHFEVMDGPTSALLLAEARRMLVTGSAPGQSSAARARLAAAFAEALETGGEWGLDQLIGEIVAKRDAIRRHVEEAGGLDAAIALLHAALGVAEGEDDAAILDDALASPHFPPATLGLLMTAAAASGSDTDVKLLGRLGTVLGDGAPRERFAAWCAAVLDSKGEVRGSIKGFATRAVAAAVPDADLRLRAEGERCLALNDRLKTIRLARASAAALVVADRLEADYAGLKRRRGRLDFEDLIVRTADLLSRSAAADWVHFKLDQGIDHVLIDEAQDTSPRQWEVMRSLVEEFFTGASSRNVSRTVFAVGDEKQSIYSFQGASPAMFAHERRRLGARAVEARQAFAEVSLHQSFRSAKDVLAAVDLVFSDAENRRGLASGDAPPAHSSARGEEPGLVEVWPAVKAAPVPEAADWLTPLDVQPDSSPANRLARRIAAQIAAWLGDAIAVKGTARALTPGDMIVLVRKRSGFVEAMGKALRDAGIPVAGADRLVITDHIAIEDLMALGRTVANADDELSLAAVLKSPLFGLSDDDLMALALSRGQGEPLYLALRRLAAPDGKSRLPDFVPEDGAEALLARLRQAFGRLEELRDRAGFESVFSFYARLLGPEGGRARLTARLGRDAGEVIDAFLDLALSGEEAGQPGLDAFLADLAASPPEIKREMEHGKREVRIMTVHASKGLEAPVVFLVDPGSAPFSHAHGARLMRWDAMPGLFPGQAPGFLWRAEKGLENAAVLALKQDEKRRAGEEYRRLLYVGMTRAADRLVVCGTAGARDPHEESWLSRVSAALGPASEDVKDADGITVARRYGSAASGAKRAVEAVAAGDAVRALDLSPLPPEVMAPRPLSPSTAGETHLIDADADADEGGSGEARGATTPVPNPQEPQGASARYVSPVLSGAAEPSFAIRRGLAIHRLLQVLPDIAPEEREAAGRRYLDASAGAFPERERQAALASALAVLKVPDFASLFSPGSRAEVAVAGTLRLGPRDYAVSGTVDRLGVEDGIVRIVDYKTNRPAPASLGEVPPAYILQLALYRLLLLPLYPGHEIRAALLFTETPEMIEIPAAVLAAAVERRAGVFASGTQRQAPGAIA